MTEAQRRYRERREAERMKMPTIPCACGCGTHIAPLTAQFKPARYARGHNARELQSPTRRTCFTPGQRAWNASQPSPWATATHKGKRLSADEITKRKETRLAKNGGRYQIARGWRLSEETRARISLSVLKRDLTGARNPFFGKRHPPELIARIAMMNSGPNNAGWRGGTSTLPYGPEFTRALKRQIRERDGHTCQRCGKPQSQHWRTLEVHHIDHDKLNNHHSNLVTVCGACNIWCSYHRDQPFTPLSRLAADSPRPTS